MTLTSHDDVSLTVVQRKRRKEHATNRAQKIPDLFFRVIQIAAAMKRRITDEQQSFILAFNFRHIFTSVIFTLHRLSKAHPSPIKPPLMTTHSTSTLNR